MLKGLPLAYNRDLQEDKEAVFDIVDTLQSSIDVMAALLRGLTFRTERIVEAARLGFSTATDLAEHLALAGVPFRQAHHIVGNLVRYCHEGGKAPEELRLEELKKFSPRFDGKALKLLSVEASVASKKILGGTAPGMVRAALRSARKRNVWAVAGIFCPLAALPPSPLPATYGRTSRLRLGRAPCQKPKSLPLLCQVFGRGDLFRSCV